MGRTNLAKPGWLERSCSHEILGLGREEPSFDHSHSSRCDCLSRNRAARPDARGLRVRDRDLGGDAIEPRGDANGLATFLAMVTFHARAKSL